MSKHQPILIARAKMCEALRSGKYKQGYGAYSYRDRYNEERRFCFYGVAREVFHTCNDFAINKTLGITRGSYIRANDEGVSFENLALKLEKEPLPQD